MKIRKLLICFCAVITAFSITACGDDDSSDNNTKNSSTFATDTADSASANPLSGKEYPELAISKKTDFNEVLTTLLQDYINAVNSYNTYTQDHSAEFALNRQVCDIPDYEEAFECWYQWFYKINSVEDENVPDEYKAVWEHFKNMASYDKPFLDAVYTSNLNDMCENMDKVLEYGSTEVEAIQEEYAKLLGVN